METITTALTTAFADVQTTAESLIAAGLPYALGIGAIIIGISIGWKTFKKFTKG